MFLDFIYVNPQIPQSPYNRERFKLRKRIIAIAVFTYNVGLKNPAAVIMKKGLFFYVEIFANSPVVKYVFLLFMRTSRVWLLKVYHIAQK